MAADRYDIERVETKSLQVGDLVMPPGAMASVMKVTDFWECENHPGWYHMLVMRGDDDSLVREGEVFVRGTYMMRVCHPKVKYQNVSGKDFLASLGVKG